MSVYVSQLLFDKGIAVVNFVAFLSFYVQQDGKNGITPIASTLQRLQRKYQNRNLQNVSWLLRVANSMYFRNPTLFWFSSDDWMLHFVTLLGLACSIFAFFGFMFPICIQICMICYFSLLVVGQPWLGLQMHATLIETNFLTVWSFPFRSFFPLFPIFLIRFLVWRIMLGCGACKYGTRERTWRDLKAMNYHYYTQPLPNPLSWYAHRLSDRIHKLEVIATHIVEGPLTFFAFGTSWMRVIAFMSFVGLNLGINLTGNYGFLGLLTTVQSLTLIDDSIFHLLLPTWVPKDPIPSPSFSAILLSFVIALPYLTVSMYPLLTTFYGTIPWLNETEAWLSSLPRLRSFVERFHQTRRYLLFRFVNSFVYLQIWKPFWTLLGDIYFSLGPWRIINRYAKFGTMRKDRWELIIEGCDEWKGAETEWKEYNFRYKPGPVNRRPPMLPFHLPSLDWQIWFLPIKVRRHGPDSLPDWYFSFLERLLEGREEVNSLMGSNPFVKSPPEFIRTMIYDYKFCYGRSDQWYFREMVSSCGSPISLKYSLERVSE